MAAYSYEALDAQGKTIRGIVEADHVRAARVVLRTRELVPLEVSPVAADSTGVAAFALWHRPVMGTTALAIWTRQLAGLVCGGLPLERALSVLIEGAESDGQRDLVAALRAEINAGSGFAAALARHPREFLRTYCAVVQAGEQGGDLGLVLDQLAQDLEEQQALKVKLTGTMLYPAVVTLVAALIVLFLLTYVVPRLPACSLAASVRCRC